MAELEQQLQAEGRGSTGEISLRALLGHGQNFGFLWQLPLCSFFLFAAVVLKVAVPSASKVRGDLPFQKCRTALDSATISGGCSKEDISSYFVDVIAHIGQDVSSSSFSSVFYVLLFYISYVQSENRGDSNSLLNLLLSSNDVM